MYSPKINESLIPKLYHLKQIINKPMTVMVNEAIVQYLQSQRKEKKNGQERTQKDSC